MVWVSESLKQMQTIKAGVTRQDLRKVFTTEGGGSTGLWRRYVFPQCPYFKVDVEFEAVGRPERDADGRVTLNESDRASSARSLSRISNSASWTKHAV
jgi:hypothetical protein